MQKINELEIPHFIQCLWIFLNNYAYICSAFWMPSCGVKEDEYLHQSQFFIAFRTFYKDNFLVETGIKMIYCAIFRCTKLVIIENIHLS